MPSYARVRQALGLGAINSVDDITDDPVVRQRLKKAFTRPATPGATPTLQITDIDLLTGSLAEPHVRGSCLGRTFFTILTVGLIVVNSPGDDANDVSRWRGPTPL